MGGGTLMLALSTMTGLCGCAAKSAVIPEASDIYVHQWDKDHDGRLSYEEFRLSVRKSPNSSLVSETEVRAMFEDYDANHDGYISTDEMKKVNGHMPEWPETKPRG